MRKTHSVPLTADGQLDIPALLERNRQLFGDLQMTLPTPPAPEPPAPTPPAPPAPPAPAPPAPTPPAPAPADRGFPENTPVAEMTDAQQAAYWRFHARKHEETAKSRGDYDVLREKATQFDALQEASASETEKQVKAAREEGKKETLPALVRAEFKAAAAGRIEAEQLATILEPLDLTKFLTAKDEVDEAKVKTYVDGIAPAGGGTGGRPDMGQGRRAGSGKLAGREAGLAEAQKRFKKTAAQQ